MHENFFILAVDDEPFNLELIEAIFSEDPHITITSVTNGNDALKKLKTNFYDVVLLDISMPQMDGLEVLQQIRAQYQYLPVLMVTANSEREVEALTLGANDFLQKPYNVDVLKTRTLNYAKMNRYQNQIKDQNKLLEQRVKEKTHQLQQALLLAKKTEYEISIRLGRASEFRDIETGGHIKRMSHYAQLLAQLYGLDKEECELVLYAAPLHDIGKVGIADKILLKPSKLNQKEFAVMQQHAQIGAAMLDSSDDFPVLKAGYIIALEHHEKWNGTGYPFGKKGKDIHLYARIVAIADVFDALSSKRCYKEEMPLQEVIALLKKESGKHFDPELVTLFLDNLDQFLVIQNEHDDEEMIANVMELIEHAR